MVKNNSYPLETRGQRLARTFGDVFFTVLLSGLLSFSFASGILAPTVFGPLPLSVLPLALGIAFLFRLLMENKYTVLSFLGVAGLLALLLLFSTRAREPFLPLLHWLAEEFSLLFGVISDPDTLYLVNMRFFAGVLLILFSFFMLLNLHVFFHLFAITLTGLAVFIAPFALGYSTSRRDILLFLFCFLVLLVRRMNLFVLSSSREDSFSQRGFHLGALLLALVILGTSFVIPQPTLPERSRDKGIRDVGKTVTDEISYRFQEKPLLSFSQRQDFLGGPLTQSNALVMTVTAEEPLYLASGYKNTYTGSYWQQQGDDYHALQLPEDNTAATYFAVPTSPYPASQQEKQQYYQRFYGMETKSATITLEDYYTKELFTPPFQQSITLDQDTTLERATSGALMSSKALPPYVWYTQQYISWNYENTYFLDALRQAGQQPLSQQEVEFHGLTAYLALPETVTPRTVELTQSITQQYSNNYDKLRAIEDYLIQFPYTLSPETPPEEQDFVDYFLFHEQKGYCVYYATAMAVMGRTLGIPTRYVEGYVTPSKPDNTGVYQVTGELAHAWTEAYFPEFGWIAFEPTSIYHYEEYAPPEQMPPEEPVLPEEPDSPQTQPELPTEPEELETETFEPKLPEKDNSFRWLFLTFFLILLIALLGLAGYLLYKRYQQERKRREELSTQEKVLTYYPLTETLLSFLGYSIYPQESSLAFAKRIEPALSSLLPDFIKAAEIYSKAAYSQEDITEPESAFVKEVYQKCFVLLQDTPISFTGHSQEEALSLKDKLAFWFAHYILLTV